MPNLKQYTTTSIIKIIIHSHRLNNPYHAQSNQQSNAITLDFHNF